MCWVPPPAGQEGLRRCRGAARSTEGSATQLKRAVALSSQLRHSKQLASLLKTLLEKIKFPNMQVRQTHCSCFEPVTRAVTFYVAGSLFTCAESGFLGNLQGLGFFSAPDLRARSGQSQLLSFWKSGLEERQCLGPLPEQRSLKGTGNKGEGAGGRPRVGLWR